MQVKKIILNNFRNYTLASFEPHPAINIITGPNAQGKTNLLESIYYSLRGRSFRAEKDLDVIKWNCDSSSVNLELEVAQRNFQVRWNIKKGNKKLFINGVDTPRSELTNFGVVLFCPEDLYLVKGSPQQRRNFLDQEVGPLNSSYSYACRQYARVLNQRNSLLKEIRDKRSPKSMLEIWDEQLYRHGAKVIYLRLQNLQKLVPVARKIHYEITNGKEELQARYLSSLVLEQGMNEEQIYKVFLSASDKLKSSEIQRCQTLLGPHRDDINLFINGVEARSFCSQGQQRTLTLSLKICQIELWQREFGNYPILLLDDVLFELDQSRQTMLIERLQDKVQTFITTSFPGGIEKYIGQAGQIWHIQSGNLSAKEEL